MLVAEEEDGDIMPLVVLIMVLPTVRREACDHDQYGPSIRQIFLPSSVASRLGFDSENYRSADGVEGRDGGRRAK